VIQVSETERPRTRTGTRKVLVVDDNRDAADALSALLRFMGYQVQTAYDSQIGLDLAQDFHPDVAIWDLTMPQIDGFQAARTLRAHAQGRSVLLIAFSGQKSPQASAAARAAGFDMHVSKPMDVAVLLDAVGCA
jgi:CheY-like chemotaxis protein